MIVSGCIVRSGLVVLGTAALALATLVGCDSPASRDTRHVIKPRANSQSGLFDSVVENLDRMEQFDTGQILKQICDRLNQWYQQEKPKIDWKPDPLVGTLPSELQNLTAVKLLDSVQYRMPDAWYLQESVWMRDISKNARADQFQDLAVAERLFDWTVRNIQLEPDAGTEGNSPLPHRPSETLLLGRGQAVERDWTFVLLARQQGLDVVFLGLGEANGTAARPWLTALVSGGELYLFDGRLGLPIPGPGGKGVATLGQVVADPQLLRRLDLDAEHPYPVQAEELAHVVACVEGSPVDLSRRMALVESRLVGKHKMALTSSGSALAEKVRKIAHVEDVRLWPVPFELWKFQTTFGDAELKAAAREMLIFQVMPDLMKARALDFKGVYDGERGAKKLYLAARPPDDYIRDFKLPAELARQLKKEDISKEEALRVVIMQQGKQSASYWLGLVHFAEQNYPGAIDFFEKRTLEASPKGPWTPGARYNLARAYEAENEIDKAIALYESDAKTPQSHGNRLRARWLKERSAAAEAK